jgi:hypothetical protein
MSELANDMIFDLWIIPPATHSAWFSRLDWYLNWQMCKGLSHRNAPPHAEVFRLAGEHGLTIDAPLPGLGEAPLMISGQRLLPTKACVVLDYTGDLKTWLSEAKSITSQMQIKNSRVYLPAGASVAKAVEIWEKLKGTCLVEFMDDERELE